MKNTVTLILQRESVAALEKVPAGTVNARSARLGVYEGEPLLVIADALLSYAKAYRSRFESPVSGDGVLGPNFVDMLQGCRRMLDGDGGVALRRGITTDSKDNGSVCDILEAACEVGGFNWEEL